MARPPSDETELWRPAMRDVAPLPGRPSPPEPRPERGRPARAAGETPAVRSIPPPPLPPLDRNAGADPATAERVRRRRYRVEATLHLHGMTQEEAHRALSRFIAASRAGVRP